MVETDCSISPNYHYDLISSTRSSEAMEACPVLEAISRAIRARIIRCAPEEERRTS